MFATRAPTPVQQFSVRVAFYLFASVGIRVRCDCIRAKLKPFDISFTAFYYCYSLAHSLTHSHTMRATHMYLPFVIVHVIFCANGFSLFVPSSGIDALSRAHCTHTHRYPIVSTQALIVPFETKRKTDRFTDLRQCSLHCAVCFIYIYSFLLYFCVRFVLFDVRIIYFRCWTQRPAATTTASDNNIAEECVLDSGS